MDATIDFNKRIQYANPLHRSLSVFFIVATTTTLLTYTRPSVDSNIFRRLYANKHILNFDKAIAMQFSQNKALCLVLNTWYSLGKNCFTSIFSILFPEGPVLFDSPRTIQG